MGFFRRLLGTSDNVDKIKKAYREERWSDVLLYAELLQNEGTDDSLAAELRTMIDQARDSLATLNLEEGEACLRLGDSVRALEHFELASSQVNSGELKGKIAEAVARLQVASPYRDTEGIEAETNSCGCSSPCSPEIAGVSPVEHPENQSDRLELILESYPPQVRNRYIEASPVFLNAFLLSQEGSLHEAIDAFEAVPDDLRDDLFFFERGVLRLHLNDYDDAKSDIEASILLNPENILAKETFIDAVMASGNFDLAEVRLNDLLEQYPSFFVHSRFAILYAQKGDSVSALDHCHAALKLNDRDPEMLLLGASLSEDSGEDDDAETMLLRLSGHGCSSSIPLPLAEFYLRKRKSLDKALETFKAALRKEPRNPIWLFRIAQTYMAKGWHREAAQFFHQLQKRPDLSPDLKSEIESALKTLP